MSQQAKEEHNLGRLKNVISKCHTSPKHLYNLQQNVKVQASDGSAKRGRDEQTMLLPLGVCNSVNK